MSRVYRSLLSIIILFTVWVELCDRWQQIPSKIPLGTNNGPTPPPRDWLATTLYCIILELNLLNSTCWLCVYFTSGIGRASAPSVVTVRSLFPIRNKGHIRVTPNGLCLTPPHPWGIASQTPLSAGGIDLRIAASSWDPPYRPWQASGPTRPVL